MDDEFAIRVKHFDISMVSPYVNRLDKFMSFVSWNHLITTNKANFE